MKGWVQHIRPVVTLSAITAFIMLVAFLIPKAPVHKKSAASPFAVIELFTSEGCSSCPPADAAVAKASQQYAGKVYVLGFHVDYWNKLGWRDEYSSAAWTLRQMQYVQQFNLESSYTPQIVLNGKMQFVGSDEGILKSSIEEALQNEPPVEVTLSARKNDNTVTVSYTLSKTDNAILNIALVQLKATTAVKKGENHDKTLEHINIVREFSTVRKLKNSGKQEISIPSGLFPNECMIIAYLQDKDKWHVLGAAETVIK